VSRSVDEIASFLDAFVLMLTARDEEMDNVVGLAEDGQRETNGEADPIPDAEHRLAQVSSQRELMDPARQPQRRRQPLDGKRDRDQRRHNGGGN
jgi:hypothetical protein